MYDGTSLAMTYRKPFDILAEGLSVTCGGADVVVTGTLERVIERFREALGSRSDMALIAVKPGTLRNLVQDLDARTAT